MAEERPDVIVLPTELDRADSFWDLAVLAITVLGAWYVALYGLFWWSVPVLVLVAVWTLTGEPAADVPFVGAVASGLRSRLGLRRAHEWAMAYAHYVEVAEWPKGKARWQTSRLRSAMRTSIPWLKLPSGNGAARLSKRLRFWNRC